jgi:hypothetical protein
MKKLLLILILAAAPAWSATFRACSSGTGTSTSVTMTEPSGTAQGDLVFATLSIENTDTPAIPATWSNNAPNTSGVPTAMSQQATTGGAAFVMRGYWVYRNASAPSYQWTWTNSTFFSWITCSHSSVCPDGVVWSAGAVRDNTSAATFPAITGGSTTELALMDWRGYTFSNATAGAPPTGWTERVDAATPDHEAATFQQTSIGAVGSVTGASYTGTNSTAAAIMIAMRNTCIGQPPNGANSNKEVWTLK